MDAVLEVHGAYRAFVGNRKRGKVVEGTPSCQQCDQCQDAGSDEHGLAFNPHSPPPLGALCWAFLHSHVEWSQFKQLTSLRIGKAG